MTLPKFLRLAACLAVVALPSLPLSASELNVRVSGIAGTGTIHVFVFTSAEGFPKEESAVVHASQAATGNAQIDMIIQVPDAPEYALMAYLDKNGDGKMNRLFGMIPQEPYALSRNPDVFGKPKFMDAAIRPHDGESVLLKLRD